MRSERNYRLLDAGRSFAYKDEKKALAIKYGCSFITEACEKLYNEYGTLKGAEMMDMSKEGFAVVLRYIGVQRNKKKRGGRRISADGLNEEMVRKAKFVWDGCSVDARYIEALQVILGVHVSNNCMRSMLRGETWGDITV